MKTVLDEHMSKLAGIQEEVRSVRVLVVVQLTGPGGLTLSFGVPE